MYNLLLVFLYVPFVIFFTLSYNCQKQGEVCLICLHPSADYLLTLNIHSYTPVQTHLLLSPTCRYHAITSPSQAGILLVCKPRKYAQAPISGTKTANLAINKLSTGLQRMSHATRNPPTVCSVTNSFPGNSLGAGAAACCHGSKWTAYINPNQAGNAIPFRSKLL
jgi:hypothetical protein